MSPRALTLLVVLAGCADYSMSDQGGYATGDYATGEDWSSDTGAEDTEDTEDTDTADPECDGAAAEDVTWYLSADDSNSQSAPVLARAAVQRGQRPAVGERPWEFLNYYSFDYPAADEGHVRVVGQLRETDEEGRYDLLVAVVAPAVDPEERRPLNLTFSVDTSGSMGGEPLETVQAAMRTIAGELREGDVVSIVRWSSDSTVPLASYAVTGAYDPVLVDAIDSLDSSGSTDLDSGLARAYELAEANWSADRTNRVILMSDGGANTGVTSEELIGGHADDAEDEGIYLIGVGAGESYDDALMDTVTDLGKGAYVYLDSAEEAEVQFTGERLLANLEIAARNVELAMTLPAGWTIERFHGEQIDTDPEAVRDQHLAPNDAMLYHMVLRDCGADPDAPFGLSASWQEARSATTHEDAVSLTVAEMVTAEGTQVDKANAVLAWANGLGEALAASDPSVVTRRVMDEVRAARAVRPDDVELAELEALVEEWAAGF